MKTFVIVSDSHGRYKNLQKLEPLFSENSFVVHLGDGSSDMRWYVSQDPNKFYVMKGNCDFSYGQEECVIEEEGVSIFCCHGHRYGVKRGLGGLAARAGELGCSVALYGHTHRADIAEVDGVLCINPGALGSYTSPSYCYLAVHRGKVTPTLVEL